MNAILKPEHAKSRRLDMLACCCRKPLLLSLLRILKRVIRFVRVVKQGLLLRRPQSGFDRVARKVLALLKTGRSGDGEFESLWL